MKNAGVIGHFAFGHQFLDGQTVKTKIVAQELERSLEKENIEFFDTYGGIKNIFRILFNCYKSLKKYDNVVAMPDSNGVRVIFPWLSALNMVFKRRIHYVVIGGWLPEFLKKKYFLKSVLKKLCGIYVETTSMEKALINQGFKNIVVMPNCKDLSILNEEQLIYNTKKPYKLCTFSRVMKEKGIEDAINAVKKANEKYGEPIYTLDIYGQVDPEQVEWFENLKSDFPEYIRYGGLVPYDKSVEILKDYFLLLFPTRFYTEGIPGTIIDAYAAGIPVISAKWENYRDIIDENVTGRVYEFDNYEGFEKLLSDIAQNPENLNEMKINCIKKAKEFLPEEVVSVLTERL